MKICKDNNVSNSNPPDIKPGDIVAWDGGGGLRLAVEDRAKHSVLLYNLESGEITNYIPNDSGQRAHYKIVTDKYCLKRIKS